MFVFATPFESQKQYYFKVRKQFHITKEFNVKYLSEPIIETALVAMTIRKIEASRFFIQKLLKYFEKFHWSCISKFSRNSLEESE